jgi:ubiquinone/menaquinone biosynthesis C-methylase UbiE
MSFEPSAHRDESRQSWEAAAAGWVRRQDLVRRLGEPVSHWMVEALELQPGERVLELAAGLGEPGMLAAELVGPMGGVIISDQAEAMLEGARERALSLGLSNVEFQVLGAEWIDLPVASVDAVLCRWGYMLMADPAAALAETRRVLRPGGRLALAVWDAIAQNPWAQLPRQELRERGLVPEASEGEPGPFALGDRDRLAEMLAEAGFSEIVGESMDLVRRHPSYDDLWETTLDLSHVFHDAVLARPAAEIEQIKSSLAERFAPYTDAGGALAIPGRTLLARATA